MNCEDWIAKAVQIQNRVCTSWWSFVLCGLFATSMYLWIFWSWVGHDSIATYNVHMAGMLSFLIFGIQLLWIAPYLLTLLWVVAASLQVARVEFQWDRMGFATGVSIARIVLSPVLGIMVWWLMVDRACRRHMV